MARRRLGFAYCLCALVLTSCVSPEEIRREGTSRRPTRFRWFATMPRPASAALDVMRWGLVLG
jgi:hypothetical protein